MSFHTFPRLSSAYKAVITIPLTVPYAMGRATGAI